MKRVGALCFLVFLSMLLGGCLSIFDESDESDELLVAEGFGGCDNEFYLLQKS